MSRGPPSSGGPSGFLELLTTAHKHPAVQLIPEPGHLLEGLMLPRHRMTLRFDCTGTPADILPDATAYARIMLIAAPGLFVFLLLHYPLVQRSLPPMEGAAGSV